MDRSEENGLRSAFYFMTGVTNPQKEGDGDIDHPSTRALIRRIYARGHEIGLHPSFETYLDADQLGREADKLRAVLNEESIPSVALGGRMHYLRWRTPETMRGWEQAGMTYDSTLGYADHVGFRCGTSHEYPAFDLQVRQRLRLRLRPLIVMERSLFSPKYLGVSAEHALCEIATLKDRCRKFNGVFTLLWHNSELVDNVSRSSYCSVIKSS